MDANEKHDCTVQAAVWTLNLMSAHVVSADTMCSRLVFSAIDDRAIPIAFSVVMSFSSKHKNSPPSIPRFLARPLIDHIFLLMLKYYLVSSKFQDEVVLHSVLCKYGIGTKMWCVPTGI